MVTKVGSTNFKKYQLKQKKKIAVTNKQRNILFL